MTADKLNALDELITGFTPANQEFIRKACDKVPTRDGWGYETIVGMAKLLGCTVKQLIAMSTGSDPFYVGPKRNDAKPSVVARADWFEGVWNRLKIHEPVHLRRLHYRIMSLGDVEVQLTDTSAPVVYKNGEEFWTYLQNASVSARYLSRVPLGMIEDHRNPPARQYTVHDSPEPDLSVVGDYHQSAAWGLGQPNHSFQPSYYLKDYPSSLSLARQRYHIEVWCEKTTQDDILEPWCRAHSAVYVTASGHMTISGAYQTVERIVKHGKPDIILYVSDFDSDGMNMPLEIARKLERYVAVEFRGKDVPRIVLEQVALNHQQVKDYELPTLEFDGPLTRKDGKLTAAGKWMKQYGCGKAELDALEVWHYGELKKLLDGAVEPYWDEELVDRIDEAEQNLKDDLDKIEQQIIKRHERRLKVLEKQWVRAWKKAKKILAPTYDAISEEHVKMATALKGRMPNMSDYLLPEAKEADPELVADALFNSERTYMEQLAYYKRYKQLVAVTESEDDENGDED